MSTMSTGSNFIRVDKTSLYVLRTAKTFNHVKFKPTSNDICT